MSATPLIFLTGCINPGGMGLTKLQDPKARKEQYVNSIFFYLRNTTSPVLFIENSNSDISTEFKPEIRSGRLEIITFDGNRYNKDLGKGYGEMLIIEHALQNSALIKRANCIFKITGRYKILNINDFLKENEVDNSWDLLVDFKRNLTFCDSRFWGCNFSFLNEIFVKYKSFINDSEGFYFEHALSKATHEAILKDYKYSMLKTLPRFSGIYGTDNTTLKDSWLHWFPRNIQQKIRYKMIMK